MRFLKKIYDGIGRISELATKTVMWTLIVLIIIICYDVMMRYVFNMPTIWQFHVSYMILASIVAMGWAYLYYIRGNVRVDLIYVKFPPMMKLIIDVFFTVVFFLPLFFMLAYEFVDDAWYAYSINEAVKEHGIFYPITWPYKSLVALGFCLLWVQALATFMEDVLTLAKGGKKPW